MLVHTLVSSVCILCSLFNCSQYLGYTPCNFCLGFNEQDYFVDVDALVMRREISNSVYVTYIVIVISRFLKRYSKAKRTRAPAYLQALRRNKGSFPKGGQEKLMSDFQNTRRGQSSC